LLSSDDLAMFAKIGVPTELLDQADVCRVTDAEARVTYGCELKVLPGADMSGIIFPYLNSLNGLRSSARLRRDNPERKPDGRPGKQVRFGLWRQPAPVLCAGSKQLLHLTKRWGCVSERATLDH
jgi:hypothetical protein